MSKDRDPFDEADALLRAEKRTTYTALEEFQALKRVCEKSGDFNGARVLRDLVSDAMKQYRAVCFVAPWFMATPVPGDCAKLVPRSLFPIDLAPELDRVIGRLILAN